MTTLQKFYEEITNKSRFLAHDNCLTAVDNHNEHICQKLSKLDTSIERLPDSIQQYIACLCDAFKKTGQQERLFNINCAAKLGNTLNLTVKKICEVYAIGLLVCDDLLTRINFLNVNKKTAKSLAPFINFNNTCHNLSWISATLFSAINRSAYPVNDSRCFIELTEAEINTLNAYSKLLTHMYNSSALGIFRKQPLRKFTAEQFVISA